MAPPAITSLSDQLPDGTVVTDPDILGSYRQDRAFDPGAGTPLAVVRPRRTEEVQTVLRWATANAVPVVPRGMGTGLSGGATAVDGAIVLSTEKMRDITVDPVTRTAVAQPGLLNAEVKKAVAEYGLWYPPDPSSFEICSIGGNIATNAGGLCCVKYGVTTDYVLGLQVVLADGTAVRLGGPRLKDVAGLSLTKLFVGSEGTLGVVTEVTLRLLPPQHTPSTVVASFDSVRSAADAVLTITAKIRPSMLEFMDSVAINAVEDKLKMGLDRNAAAMRVAASDERGQAGHDDAEFMAQVFTENGATEVFSTSDPDEGEAFVAARRFAIPAVEAKGSLL
ncbi:MAG: FAD-binding protein, partial [Mycobacterium sp.]